MKLLGIKIQKSKIIYTSTCLYINHTVKDIKIKNATASGCFCIVNIKR